MKKANRYLNRKMSDVKFEVKAEYHDEVQDMESKYKDTISNLDAEVKLFFPADIHYVTCFIGQ